MYYRDYMQITGRLGNNAIAYEARKTYGSKLSLDVPSVQHLPYAQRCNLSYEQIRDVSRISLEEVRPIVPSSSSRSCMVSEGKQNAGLFSYPCIRHIYTTHTPHGTPVYLMDNHNHALRAMYTQGMQNHASYCIHIDQHSDMATPQDVGDHIDRSQADQVSTYVNESLQVGNFLVPALRHLSLIDCLQVRAEYALLHMLPQHLSAIDHVSWRVDIDVDFRDASMGIEHYEQTIKATSRLIHHPNTIGVSIALSPYFIPIQKAYKVWLDLIGKV